MVCRIVFECMVVTIRILKFVTNTVKNIYKYTKK